MSLAASLDERAVRSGDEATSEPVPDSRARRLGLFGCSPGRLLGLAALAVTVVSLAVLDYPVVFGRWEGFATFPVMLGSGPVLALDITPGGFTYDFNKGRFSLVDAGYYTAEWLGWSLAAFRLPALIAGALSVVLLFVVTRRAFGFWPALVGALALVVDPMFLLFWHQLIVSTITVFFLLLVIERYQYLELSRHQPRSLLWSVPTLALAFVFLLIHHGPGRVYGGVLMGYWAADVAWRAVQARRAGEPVDRASLLAVPACGMLIVGFAVLLDVRNARYLASPIELLVVPQSEFIKTTDHLRYVVENLPAMVTSIFPPLNLAPGWFGTYSTDVLVDYRYYVLPISMLPLFLLGLGMLLGQVRRSGSVRMPLLLLAVMFVGPLFSSGTSLSQFRMIYLAIPSYLCVAAGAAWLLARQGPVLRYGAAGLLAILLLIQVTMLGVEVSRHRAFMDALADRWTPTMSVRELEKPEDLQTNADGDRLTNGSYRYYVDWGGVLARGAAQRVKSRVEQPAGPRDVVVVQLDGPIQRGDDAAPLKLVFFLRELGMSAALFDPTTHQIRGSGYTRPSLVVATNAASAMAARRLLETAGLNVQVREVRPHR